MASQFQNRLVGISILVATVVIFLPTVIDGKKKAYEDEFVSTPIHPELKEHNQQLVTQKGSLVSAEQATNDDQQWQDVSASPQNDDQWQVEEIKSAISIDNKAPINSTDIAEIKQQSEPHVASKAFVSRAEKVVIQRETTKISVPESAWTIQLGAFQNASNINSLLKILHKAGFQAHTVPSQVIDGELTRLFVGPDISKAKLKKQLPRLKRLTKLEGKLYPFDAVNP